ncbi:MAG: hypothetical protein A4E20_01320 [Nitrospira sp. SG-bin2]|nr:MAG: hypothetical protein A4E20_01320 [Nitrospira sp. SG-bin2]
MTSLENNVAEIVLRCTSKVCSGFSPGRIVDIAEPLVTKIVDLIVRSDSGVYYEMKCDRYEVWLVLNQILDEVAKEIPAASRLDIIGTNIRRFHRAAYLEEKAKDATTASHRDQAGGSQALDL